jgi:hypothetical protein
MMIFLFSLKAFSSNNMDTMAIPDTDLLYLITNTKVNLSFYDVAEINQAYNCVGGEFSHTVYISIYLLNINLFGIRL